MATRSREGESPYALSPLVSEVLQELENKDGKVALPEAALAAFAPRFKMTPAADRELLLVDTVAAAVKLQRLGGAAAADAIASLCELAALAAGKDAAEAAFAGQGLATRAQQNAIGGAAKLTAPAAEEKPKGPAPKPRRGLR